MYDAKTGEKIEFTLDAEIEGAKGSLKTDLEKVIFGEMTKHNVSLKRMGE